AKAKEAATPIEYKNALKKAQSYSNMMHMSKAGIYDQLTSDMGEGFSAEAAQYAVDNLNADYNKNALEKAKSYQSHMAMSKDSIYDQLTSSYGEKFTAEEAQYAVNNLPA
ncbi:MAG: Ltp family lipoprotein, partial [Lactococcus lactis]